jgi:hypothetical protein
MRLRLCSAQGLPQPGRAYNKAEGPVVRLARAAVPVLTLLIMVSACGADTSQEGSGDRRPVSQLRLRDGVGDVFLADSNDPDDVAKTVRNVDIVSADTRRTSRFLQVSVTYHGLAPRASRSWDLSFNVVTSGDHFTRIVLWERGRYVDTGKWTQGVSVTKVDSEDSFGEPCPHAATAKADYTTDTVSVPNRCLGRTVPPWIRLDDLASRSSPPHGSNHYADNPFNETGESESTPRLVAPAR